jgi:hypothetical protein
MHFLDTIFPLQYPMYRAELMHGGRGWLLALLLRTKPFYHAALALSAYHRRTALAISTDHPYQVAALIQQEKYLQIALKDINLASQHSCPANGLGVAVSVVQLCFYEVSFRPPGSKSSSLTLLNSFSPAMITLGKATFVQHFISLSGAIRVPLPVFIYATNRPK